MTKTEFKALCEKHNAKTLFKNIVQKTPVGAYWSAEKADDIPDEKESRPVVFDVFYKGDTVEVRAYAPENWFPAKFGYTDTPF